MFRGVVCAVAVLWAQAGVAGQCAPDRLELKGEWGQVAFNVEIADTGESRAKGLMYRQSMPRQDGMLFVFDRPRQTAFWMRNTLIPLDMLFATEDGVVTKIHHNAVPLDETPIPGGTNIKYVLEVNGGLSDLFGIDEGSVMQHPSIDPNLAAWPCDTE